MVGWLGGWLENWRVIPISAFNYVIVEVVAEIGNSFADWSHVSLTHDSISLTSEICSTWGGDSFRWFLGYKKQVGKKDVSRIDPWPVGPKNNSVHSRHG